MRPGARVERVTTKLRASSITIDKDRWIYFRVYCIFFPDYRVGSSDGWSALYNFNATKNGTAWQPRFAIYGDLGVDNAQSLSKLQKEVQGGRYDAILHIGQYC